MGFAVKELRVRVTLTAGWRCPGVSLLLWAPPRAQIPRVLEILIFENIFIETTQSTLPEAATLRGKTLGLRKILKRFQAGAIQGTRATHGLLSNSR